MTSLWTFGRNPEKQEEAFRKGLIPYIPADREERKVEDEPKEERKPVDEPSLASFEGDLIRCVVRFLREGHGAVRQSSLDEEKLKMAGEAIQPEF